MKTILRFIVSWLFGPHPVFRTAFWTNLWAFALLPLSDAAAWFLPAGETGAYRTVCVAIGIVVLTLLACYLLTRLAFTGQVCLKEFVVDWTDLPFSSRFSGAAVGGPADIRGWLTGYLDLLRWFERQVVPKLRQAGWIEMRPTLWNLGRWLGAGVRALAARTLLRGWRSSNHEVFYPAAEALAT